MNKDPTAEKEAEVKEEAKKSGLWFQGGEGGKTYGEKNRDTFGTLPLS